MSPDDPAFHIEDGSGVCTVEERYRKRPACYDYNKEVSENHTFNLRIHATELAVLQTIVLLGYLFLPS